MTTTGKPISSAAFQASSASATGRPSGTGTPTDVQQSARQLLVLGDHLGDGAGGVGFGGADAALPRAVAELHETAAVEPAHRNAATEGGLDDGGGAGSKADIVGQIAQTDQIGGEIEGAIGQGGQDELLAPSPDRRGRAPLPRTR